MAEQNKSMFDRLSNEEIADSKDAFNQMDRDGDGLITTADLTAMMRSAGNNPTEADIQDMFNLVEEGSSSMDFIGYLTAIIRQMQDSDADRGPDEESAVACPAE